MNQKTYERLGLYTEALRPENIRETYINTIMKITKENELKRKYS